MGESSETILVTDDDPGVRQSFQDYLEDRGYRVLTAENGLIGLQVFVAELPDLVLLDLRMPVMGGLELVRRIKALNDAIPLIIVSGTGRLSDAVEALHLGAWDYLLKPVEDLTVLDHTVRQSLEQARLIRENREYQNNLERLVAERTQELEAANRRLHDLNERLRRIVATTSTLSSWLDMEQFGSRLLQEFAQHMNATGGSIYLVGEQGLRLLHTIDPGHAPMELSYPLAEHSVLRRVVENNEPTLLIRLEDLEELQGSGWEGYSDGSALIFPIPDEQGRVAAVLALHNKSLPPFVEQDKEIGMILASYSCESLRAIRNFEALRESERRFRDLAHMLPQAICETDDHGVITYANQAAIKAFGYTLEEMTSELTIVDMIDSGEKARVSVNAIKVLKEGTSRTEGTEYKALRKDGSTFPVLVYSAPIVVAGVPAGMRVVLVDITVRKRQEELILHQAFFDSLTDLPNRSLSLDRLSQFIREAQRIEKGIAILFLDLDDFKRINDTLGHEVGDELLVQAAGRLREAVREADTIGRLGGDEFIVIVGGLNDGEDAQAVAAALLESIRQPFALDSAELVLTASIGIAVYPQDGKTPAELLRNADTAMYHAKAEGRNTYHYFTAAMNENVSRRLLLEQHLHGALARGELYLCFQPQVELPSRTIVGFEALLRWKNRELGEVSPVEFIPIAEQTGLIVPIGQYVLTEALSMLNYLQHKHNRAFKMAVNLSPRQFRNPQLTHQIERSLSESGVPRHSLELEITEGVLMGGHSYIDKALAELHDLGVAISMDDFGTGYSSLSYLRRYPFDTLKIDRSFVKDVAQDPRGRELVNATIAMAHGLGLKVVAEGVETEAQLKYIEQQGCNYAQGYLFSRPACQEALEDLLDNL